MKKQGKRKKIEPTTRSWSLQKLPPPVQPLANHCPTIGQSLANHWPTIGQPLASHSPTIGQPLANRSPTICQQFASLWPAIGRPLANLVTVNILADIGKFLQKNRLCKNRFCGQNRAFYPRRACYMPAHSFMSLG